MPLDQQAQLSTFRWLFVSSASVAAAPNAVNPFPFNPSPLASAHFVMAPVTPHGLQTTGMLFMIKAPDFTGGTAATAGAGGFTVTPWILDPATTIWGSGAAFSASYDQLFTTFDFDASAVFFQIGNVAVAGNLMFGICEQ